MPKLSSSAIDENKAHIEQAAKELFIRQGFHATPMRAIAARADVSLGNLYNYYRTKEELLASIINGYQKIINARLQAILAEIDEPFLPAELMKFGRRVRLLVNEHADYWLLMYIDILEFENQHFRKMFEGLAPKLRQRFAAYFAGLKRERRLHEGVDPAIAFAAVYMQFFNYFLVEKLFGGRRHFGLSDEQVITALTGIFCRGVLRREPVKRSRSKTGGAVGDGVRRNPQARTKKASAAKRKS
jgi:AcrR family transcriptional regulator